MAGTDAELIADCREGQLRAFTTLVDRYKSLVCGVAYSITGDAAMSEDIAQETFLIAWRNLEKLRDPSSARSWLAGIARNQSRQTARRRRRERPCELSADTTDDGAPDPRERAISRESQALVWDALQRVPMTYREVLVLYYRNESSAREVARELGISEASVLQRLSRGRRYLKESVDRMVEKTLAGTRPRAGFTAGVVALVGTVGPSAAEAAATSHLATTNTSRDAGSLTGGFTMFTSFKAGKWIALSLLVGATAAYAATRSASSEGSSDSVEQTQQRAALSVADQRGPSHATPPAPWHTEESPAPMSVAPAAAHDLPEVPAGECGGTAPCGDCAEPPPGDCDACANMPDVNQTTPMPPEELIAEISSESGPTRGAEDAPIQIVVFSSFKCRFCVAALGTIDELLEKYPGKLRVVHRFFPLTETDIVSAEAALAAHVQGRFWAMHDLLYANQDHLERADLERYAAQLGLDMEQFRGDLDARSHRQAVLADREAAQSLEVRGTPTFFINGERLIGNLPVSRFHSVIDRQLAASPTAATAASD